MLGQNKEITKKYIELLSAIRDNGGVECEQVPHIFFPEDLHTNSSDYYAEKKLALQICARCPVKRQCADYALTAAEPFGIWGGTVPSNR
ncbi:MAG: WhiB family transcriptional regulator [Actinobacteria bacterium]|nr:WhiB family transcriptional regulator [Actinomycetota bacterium]